MDQGIKVFITGGTFDKEYNARFGAKQIRFIH